MRQTGSPELSSEQLNSLYEKVEKETGLDLAQGLETGSVKKAIRALAYVLLFDSDSELELEKKPTWTLGLLDSKVSDIKGNETGGAVEFPRNNTRNISFKLEQGLYLITGLNELEKLTLSNVVKKTISLEKLSIKDSFLLSKHEPCEEVGSLGFALLGMFFSPLGVLTLPVGVFFLSWVCCKRDKVSIEQSVLYKEAASFFAASSLTLAAGTVVLAANHLLPSICTLLLKVGIGMSATGVGMIPGSIALGFAALAFGFYLLARCVEQEPTDDSSSQLTVSF